MGKPQDDPLTSPELVQSFTQDADPFSIVEGAGNLIRSDVDALLDAPPVPPTVASFSEGQLLRPPNSSRSFYNLAQGDGGAAIALKGFEPCASDFPDMIADFRRAGPSPHNIAEHFIHEEGKIPGCLSLADAKYEAERAHAYQSEHLAKYGEPARAPIPLAVFRQSDRVLERTSEVLHKHLSRPAWHLVETMLRDGLGAYVYHYRSLPIRARDVDFLLQGTGFAQRLLAILVEVCDADEVVDRWILEFVRMLCCGFLPGSLASLRTGACCQPQNACIDGGFVDLDSIVRFSELVDDRAVLTALHVSVGALIDTVRTLVAGRDEPFRSPRYPDPVEAHFLREFVLERVRTLVETEEKSGTKLDPRVREYFSPTPGFKALIDRLGPLVSRSSRFDRASWAFRSEFPRLLKSMRNDTERRNS